MLKGYTPLIVIIKQLAIFPVLYNIPIYPGSLFYTSVLPLNPYPCISPTLFSLPSGNL